MGSEQLKEKGNLILFCFSSVQGATIVLFTKFICLTCYSFSCFSLNESIIDINKKSRQLKVMNIFLLIIFLLKFSD